MPKAESVKVIFALCLVMLFSASSAEAGDMKFIDLGSGWRGLATQADPFDTSKYTIIQIRKDAFTFRCNECNFTTGSWGYEGLSFGAEIKYMVDDQSPVDKNGRYSTYLGGSDMVTDDRYFSLGLYQITPLGYRYGNAKKSPEQGKTVSFNRAFCGWHNSSLCR